MARVTLPSLAVALVLALGGGGGGEEEADPAPAGGGEGEGGPTVAMRDLQFEPRGLTVKAGQPVTWRNEDTLQHNVVAKEGAGPKSDLFGEGKTYSFTPREAGTIAYVCTIHPGMEGTLTVTG